MLFQILGKLEENRKKIQEKFEDLKGFKKIREENKENVQRLEQNWKKII